MSLLPLAYIIALKRTISGWRLELVLFLGILIAVALMSSGVIFSDLLSEAALRHSLDQASAEETNILVRTFIGQDAPPTAAGRVAAYRAGLGFTEERVESRFQSYLRDRAHLLESPTFFFKGHPQLELADDTRPRGDVQYFTGLLPDRIRMVQGSWPYSGLSVAQADFERPMEVAIDTLGAELLQLGVGDEMEIFPASSFTVSSSTGPPSMQAKIVGVFERVDPEDEFWFGASREFSFKSDRWTYIPLFTTEEAILNRMLGRYPSLFIDTTWFFYLDRQGVRARDVNDLQGLARSIRRDVPANLNNASIAIKLDRVLDDYKEQLRLARIPLFMIVFLVTGILVYYLGLVSGLVVKSRGTEIAMLKSRGATTSQVGLLALAEGSLLAVPAVVFGPLMALAVVRLLGRFFFGLGGGGELASVPVSLSPLAFFLGLAGGLLAVGALTVLTLVAARQGIVEFRQTEARPPRAPFIHRYYLDVLLLVLIGALWWQTQTRETFLVQTLDSRELQIDYIGLFRPLLELLAIGLLVLRVFPIVLSLVARVTEPVGPSWLVHGLRHVSRDPIMPGALIILLTLATGLGVIGSAFSSTLERSQRERVLYAAGADLRIRHTGTAGAVDAPGFADLAGEMEAVAGAAEGRRDRGSLLTSGFITTSVAVLEVDAENFSRVAWYRPDFAGGKSLADLTAPITPPPAAEPSPKDGIDLPHEAGGLALWVQPSRPDPGLAVLARLRDANGYYFDALLGGLNFRGWRRLEAELVPVPLFGRRGREQPPKVTPPFTLFSIYLGSRGGPQDPGALFLWRLSALTGEAEEIIADFGDLVQWRGQWHVTEDYSRPGLYALDASELAGPEGRGGSAVFSWAPGGVGLRGLRAGSPEEPIPAVVSRSFLEAAEARVGDTLNLSLSTYSLPFKAVAVADYFPTLDPREDPFAVVDLNIFTPQANLHSPRPLGGSDELWVSLRDPDGDTGPIVAALEERGLRLRETVVAWEMVSQTFDRPLVNAGWGGLLVLVFLVVALATTSGIMLFSYLDTRDRQTEFAIMRTLGSSKAQLTGVVWFSVILVVACGIGLGSLAGQWVGASLLPLMERAEEGARVTPPMVLQTNWTTLLVSYLVLAGVTAGTVAWLAWITFRLEVQQVLRIGEG
ncbi:MAG: hypothetical protein QGI50_14660 [Dehalococcoidia bacterium]|jgi:ABC-type lipoprotein release transport system permease subunit/uncharacterized membrane protein YiaA|nr:hypothetical protein [Dehalococcoidia bacterium]MDP7202168.1 hypothetical protein [Dehalococcoidia bacterium]HJN87448.1 FtsX-like permease family protein [Dehalococcoidia bacterium]